MDFELDTTNPGDDLRIIASAPAGEETQIIQLSEDDRLTFEIETIEVFAPEDPRFSLVFLYPFGVSEVSFDITVSHWSDDGLLTSITPGYQFSTANPSSLIARAGELEIPTYIEATDPPLVISVTHSGPVSELSFNFTPTNSTALATLSIGDITFTPNTPEPSAALLVVLGGLGYGVACLVRQREP